MVVIILRGQEKVQKLVEELENPTQELSFEILGW